MQALAELLLDPGHGGEQCLFVAGAAGRNRVAVEPGDFDTDAVGQDLHGLKEIDAFTLLDKAENVPTDVARPTLPCLTRRIDLQTGAVVVVKGTFGDVIGALSAQLQVAADDFDNVVGRTHALFEIKVRGVGHLRYSVTFAGQNAIAVTEPGSVATTTKVVQKGRNPFRPY